MTHLPPEIPMYPPDEPNQAWYDQPPPLRTSGLAIASLVLGSVGLIACCAAVPSLLGVIFALVALPAIGRGEVKGRGIAISGLVLGVIGLLIGAAVWTVLFLSPENQPVVGAQVSAKDRLALEKMGIIGKDDQIELFYPDGKFSIKEGGAAVTSNKLIVYKDGAISQQAPLAEIKAVDHTPGRAWMDDGSFLITLEDGSIITFTVTSMSGGDKLFATIFTQKVTEARESAGKSVIISEGESPADAADQPATRPARKRPPGGSDN